MLENIYYLLSVIHYLLSKITLVDARRAFHVLQEDRLNGSLTRPPDEAEVYFYAFVYLFGFLNGRQKKKKP